MIKLIIESKALLSEVKLEDALLRLDSKKFKKAYPEITPLKSSATKKYINSAIPSDIEEKYKGVLANWMISYLIKNKPKLTDLHDIFDPEFTNSAELFFQIKQQNLQRFLAKKSLSQIDSPEELIFTVAEAKPEYDKHIADKIENSRKGEGQNLIYEDDKWKVYIPETKGAACALGKGTDWCTAAPGLDYYEDYHKPDDPLIIFISKKDPSEKYQFHYGRKHFMDKDDAPIKKDKVFYDLNEIVKSLKDVMPDRVKQGAARFDYRILDNGGYYIKNPGYYKYYDKKGQLHREDGPAVKWAGFLTEWRRHGKRHREDGPAVKYDNGNEEWYINGKRHREDGPAIEFANGDKAWYQNDKLHREDGPAFESENGDKSWWLNDKRHREDGPAIDSANGDKQWFLNGKRHREDGPAIESAYGTKVWYLNDKKLSHSEWKQEVAKLKPNEARTLKEHFQRYL